MLPSECLISCHDNRGEEEKEGERYREEMGEGEEEEGEEGGREGKCFCSFLKASLFQHIEILHKKTETHF